MLNRYKKKYSLTEREYEICELMSKGYNDREISEELIIGLTTVRTHTINIYQKFCVSGSTARVKAVLKFLQYKGTIFEDIGCKLLNLSELKKLTKIIDNHNEQYFKSINNNLALLKSQNTRITIQNINLQENLNTLKTALEKIKKLNEICSGCEHYTCCGVCSVAEGKPYESYKIASEVLK